MRPVSAALTVSATPMPRAELIMAILKLSAVNHF